MSTSKRWTYKQITDNARNEITKHMEGARKAESSHVRDFKKGWAWGAYFAWYNLCVGWMTPGDDAAMQALLKDDNT